MMQFAQIVHNSRALLKASPAARYGLAIAVTLLALGLTVALRMLTNFNTFIIFFAAVTISSVYGGLRPGLLSTALAVVLGDLYVLPPDNASTLTTQDLLVLLVFTSVSVLVNRVYNARVRAEADSYTKQEAMRVTLLSIGDAVIMTDTQGLITFLNPTAEALTGWSMAEAIGQQLLVVLHIVNEQTRQPSDDPIKKVLSQKLTVGMANHTVLIARGGLEYTIEDSAAPIRDAAGTISGVVIVFRDATARREAEAAQELLIEVTEQLIPVVNNQADLSTLGTFFTRRFADWCELIVLDDQQRARSVRLHRNLAQQATLDALYDHLPVAWNTADQAMARGETISLLTVADVWKAADGINAADRARMDALNPGSQIYVPLQFNGQRYGVLGLTRTGGLRRHFTQENIAVAEDIGRRISLALDSARLARQTEIARQDAERNAERIMRLQHMTEALNGILTPDDVGRTVIDQVIHTFQGVFGGLLGLVIEDERVLRPIYFTGYQPDIEAALKADISLDVESPVSDIVRRGEVFFVTNHAEWKARYPNGDPWRDTVSLAMLSLRVDGKTIGYLAINFNVPQAFPETDRAVLRALADQAAQALQRARLYMAEQRARQQLDATLDGMSDAFFSLDWAMRYMYVNQRAAQMIGVPRAALIGQPFQDTFPTVDNQTFSGRAIHALDTNLPVTFEQYMPAVKLWLDIRLYPHADGLTAYLLDTTARHSAETQAQFSTNQLQRIIDADILGMIVAGNDGRIQQANNRFLSIIGYSQADLKAGLIDWVKMTPPGYEEVDQRAIDEGLRFGQSTALEKEYFHKDGHRVPVLLGGIYTDGTWISFIIDLTVQKRAERGLRLLTEASTILAAMDDERTIFNRIAALVVASIADWCIVFLRQPDHTIRLAAIASSDPSSLEANRVLALYRLAHLDQPSVFSHVLSTGNAELWTNMADDAFREIINAVDDKAVQNNMRAMNGSSLITVPLKSQGQPIGIIQLITSEFRLRFTTDDLRLADELAQRVSVALDNARLYAEVYQERERLQVTLSSIGDAVIATDAWGVVSFMNRVAEHLTGWLASDAIGRNMNDIFVLVNEITRQSIESPVTRVLREGKIVDVVDYTLLVTRDQTEVPIDDSGAPIRDVDGTLIGVIVVFRDIRVRRETERQIDGTLQRTFDLYSVSRQLSAARTPDAVLAALLTSRYLKQIPQAAIIVFDSPWENSPPETHQIAAVLDAAPLIGLSPDRRLADSPLLTVFTPDHPLFIPDVQADAALDPITKEALRAANIASVGLFPLWTTDSCFGALLIYHAMPQAWNDTDLQTLRVFADQTGIVLESLRLLDAERQARQEAERANQIKLQFLAMISHELRTPLTSIKGFTDTLLAPDVTWEATAQREFITIIDSEADKLGDLINQLLDLSQLQAGTMRIRPSFQPLSNVLNIALVPLTVLTRRFVLDIQVPPDLPPVLVDAPRIAEVLTNLVGNATKYTPPGSRICITAELIDSMVQVGVIDEGPGIPPESREQIFEAFRQLERKTDRPVKGAGLGLAICKGLVVAHGGQIWVTNGTPIGAAFYFTLPTASTPLAPDSHM